MFLYVFFLFTLIYFRYRYLHNVACENGNVGLFGFIDPGATFPISIEFTAYLVNRFKEGDPDRLFIMPHNTK